MQPLVPPLRGPGRGFGVERVAMVNGTLTYRGLSAAIASPAQQTSDRDGYTLKTEGGGRGQVAASRSKQLRAYP